MLLNIDNSCALTNIKQNLVVFFRILCTRGHFICSEMDGCYLGFIIINLSYFSGFDFLLRFFELFTVLIGIIGVRFPKNMSR